MTYYLYMKGRGEGCDYTIGCNQKLKELKSGTADKAAEEAVAIIRRSHAAHGDFGDDRLSKAVVLSFVQNIGLDMLYQQVDQERSAQKEISEKAKRQEDYRRLQKEFGA